MERRREIRRYLFLWLLPLALVTCKEKEPEPEPEKDALVMTTSELAANPEGQEWLLSLQSNVTVKATPDVAWITVSPPTKALVEKQFTVLVSANESGAARVGHVSFTAGKLSQRVTVSQDALPPPPPSGEYVRIKYADDLATGDVLLLVNQGGDYAMGAQEDSYRLHAAVSVKDGSIVNPDRYVAAVTLLGEEGSWKLQVTDGFLAAPTEAANQLLTVKQVSGCATWTIDMADGLAQIKARSGERNLICYNSRAACFVCSDATGGSLSEVTIYQKVIEAEPVTRFDALGFYLGGTRERVYSAGTDQFVRSYTGSALTFALLNMEGKEQLKATGYSTDMRVGDAVTLSVEWREGGITMFAREYEMKVLKDEGGKVWIGDNRGRGVILKK